MFTVSERIERDGFLVAFKGEVMTEAEAMRRGIYIEPEKPKKPARKPRKAKA